MNTIVVENNIYLDGLGDYHHCLDLLKAAQKNPNLAGFKFVPVINTDNPSLRAKIIEDFKLLAITEFYIGGYADFEKGTTLDQKLKPVYENADQVIEVSTWFGPPQRRFLKPGTCVKSILEHEKLGGGVVDAWPLIATYLKNNKNFYQVYEEFITMPAPIFNFAEAKHHVTAQLQIITDKMNEFKDNNHLAAATAAKELHDSLNKLAQTYFEYPTEMEYIKFKDQAKKAIDHAHTELDNHRGWKQVLGNIGLAILGFGVFYLAAVLINRNVFFNTTDSSKKLNNLETLVDNDVFKIKQTHS